VPHVSLPLDDGVTLAARVWLPADAESDPVPTIIEAVPYRLRDGMAQYDAAAQPGLAAHGYAVVRIDLRGSGDSGGVLLDEYLPREIDDLVQSIQWAAEQPWCTGEIGMMGLSWGGTNALLTAARRPPQLKAIVAAGATDDRYLDDVHYRGGGLLALEAASWGATMLHLGSLPPHPHIGGDGWRDAWRQRLEASADWTRTWLQHQRRDDYWRQSSLSADYTTIACPVLVVGGWGDGYSDAVLRLLDRLPGRRMGIIGPWGHQWPQHGVPEPAVGFAKELRRWWDHWLKGIDTGILGEPMLRVWMGEPGPASVGSVRQAGRWVAEDAWPSPRTEWRAWSLQAAEAGVVRLLAAETGADDDAATAQYDALVAVGAGPAVDALARPADAEIAMPEACELDGLLTCDPVPPTADVMAQTPGAAVDAFASQTPGGPQADAFAVTRAAATTHLRGGEAALVHRSPLLTGEDAGAWLATGRPGERPPDQRAEDGRSLSFDSVPLSERLEILGHAEVRLALACDRPVAQIAVRLCDVAEDGTSRLVTRGVLNLTHRHGDERPEPLEPGRRYTASVRLDATAQAVPAGHRLRVAVSTSYWPWLWPAPGLATLTLFAGPECRLRLPVRPAGSDEAAPPAFARAETAPDAAVAAQPGEAAAPHTPGAASPDVGTGVVCADAISQRPANASGIGATGQTCLRTHDLETGSATLEVTIADGPAVTLADATDGEPVGITMRDQARVRYSITEGDPLSARVETTLSTDLSSEAGLAARIVTKTELWADADAFHLAGHRRVTQDGEEVHVYTTQHTVPRDLV